MFAEIAQRIRNAICLKPSEEMVQLTMQMRDGVLPGTPNFGLDTIKLIDWYGNDRRQGIETARIRFVGGWHDSREASYKIKKDATGVRVTFEGFFPYAG